MWGGVGLLGGAGSLCAGLAGVQAASQAGVTVLSWIHLSGVITLHLWVGQLPNGAQSWAQAGVHNGMKMALGSVPTHAPVPRLVLECH